MPFRSMRIGQRGEAKLGCVIWSLLFVIAAFVAWKMIPVKLRSVQLYDYMLEQAKFASAASPKALKRNILRKAQELNLPLTEKTLKVESSGNRIRMSARYTVEVEFPGYTYVWEFEHDIDRPIFMI